MSANVTFLNASVAQHNDPREKADHDSGDEARRRAAQIPMGFSWRHEILAALKIPFSGPSAA
jgi:hypothetical protein